MDRLWAWNRPTLVRDVYEDLNRHRKVAYTTVMTVMDNLPQGRAQPESIRPGVPLSPRQDAG